MSWRIARYDYDGPEIPDLAPGSVDLVFADPPYNIGVEYEDDGTADRMSRMDYQVMVEDSIEQLAEALRPGGTLWWLCPVDHVDWIGQALTDYVGPREYLIAWHETFAQYQGDRSLTRDFRMLYVHRKGDGYQTWNPGAIRIESERQRLGDKRANPNGRLPGTVWKVRRLQGTARARVPWHPAQLPPELLDRIILGWTNEGDTVLDGFAGSGSMGMRCLEHGRNFVGVEKSKTYCRKMAERFYVATE